MLGPSAWTESPVGQVETARERAYLRAFELVVAVQSDAEGAGDEIDALVAGARTRAWPEVLRVALFAAAVAAKVAGHGDPRVSLERFLAQAEEDRAPAMEALALAMRASLGATDDDPQLALTAEEDLARAAVILESADGPLIERLTAHNSCAQAFCERWLWELCDDQYAAALKLAPDPLPSWAKLVLPAIVYNRAEMQVNWACVLRQLGDLSALDERWTTWQTVMLATPDVGMPSSWIVELEALGTLLRAIVGRDTADAVEAARAQLSSLREGAHPGAWPAGWLHLAIGLCEQRAGHDGTARAEVELATSLIDPVTSADAYDLALLVAAELDGKGAGGATMRYGRRQLGLRWTHRMAVLGSTVGRIQAERLRREHDVITQQAHLDDLTALLNRRGLARYLESLAHQGVQSVALLVADIDHFKSVNDRYGHSIGDTVLVSVGRLLHAHVRQSDCAVRLGGDEFAIVLAAAPGDVGLRRAEALVEAVRRQRWSDLAPGLNVTVSVGLASGTATELADLTERADRALYEAKRRGRDTVVADDSVRLISHAPLVGPLPTLLDDGPGEDLAGHPAEVAWREGAGLVRP
jgi:diguanylate cyclase (GGDEF)-like protein